MREELYVQVTKLTTRDLLRDIGVSVSVRTIATWTMKDRKAAADWAHATYLRQGGHNISIPPRPDVLKGFHES